jgi:hypothetical protein
MLCVALCFLLSAASCSAPAAQPTELSEPLDLVTLPLAKVAKPPERRLVGGLRYSAAGDVKTVFEFHRQQFLAAHWTEAAGASVTDQYASGMFTGGGNAIALMVLPASDAGQVSVNLSNLGDVELAKLPVPADAKSLFVGPASAMFLTEVAVAPTKDACRKLLTEQGWEPYGVAGDSLRFKRGSIRLNAFITAAPAQGGKTMITYSSERMSADLPAPPEAANIDYSDSTTRLSFDTKLSDKDLVAFYRTTLTKTGYEPTTENPFDLDGRNHQIFRQPHRDLIELEMWTSGDKHQATVTYQTGAELAELDRLYKVEMERRKAEKAKSAPQQ